MRYGVWWIHWRCRSRYGCMLVLVTLGLLTACTGGDLDLPQQPAHYVVDLADLVDAQTESRLNDYLRTLETKTTAQVVVLTIPFLKGRTLEALSLDIAHNRWKLGQQGKDNGVLILVAAKDRKYRFEVGYGLEGVLPDSLVGQFGREHLVPHFKKGNYARGLERATVAVANAIAKDAGVQLEGMPAVRGPHAVVPSAPSTSAR